MQYMNFGKIWLESSKRRLFFFEILKFWNLEILDILDQRVNKGTDFTIFTDENFMAPIIVT